MPLFQILLEMAANKGSKNDQSLRKGEGEIFDFRRRDSLPSADRIVAFENSKGGIQVIRNVCCRHLENTMAPFTSGLQRESKIKRIVIDFIDQSFASVPTIVISRSQGRQTSR